MAITYHPKVGEALWCEFDGREPEMVKRRLVVVVSPKSLQRSQLVTVVPLSTSGPQTVQDWHVRLDRDPLPNGSGADVWAKCDMLAVVCFDRLSGYHKRWAGRRVYTTLMVSARDLRAIRRGILHGLGLGEAAHHLPAP